MSSYKIKRFKIAKFLCIFKHTVIATIQCLTIIQTGKSVTDQLKKATNSNSPETETWIAAYSIHQTTSKEGVIIHGSTCTCR